MPWLWTLCAALTLVIIGLVIKIALLQKAADEIYVQMSEKPDTDSNTLITIASGDRHIRRLAASLNVQPRLLRQERRRLQSGDLELKEAVTNITHDLRTPLTAINGYLELLKQEEQSEAVCRYLAVIGNRTEAMIQLTEELFRYSMLTSGSNELNLEEIDLSAALEESICAGYALLKNNNIKPVITMPEGKVMRKLDRKALSRIFENLIGNAVKYSDGDLEIVLTGSGEISFTNNAHQLDELQVGKLFNRFYTVEDAKKSTGLGLSIAKALTEQMGGTIGAHYQNGKLSIRIVF